MKCKKRMCSSKYKVFFFKNKSSETFLNGEGANGLSRRHHSKQLRFSSYNVEI